MKPHTSKEVVFGDRSPTKAQAKRVGKAATRLFNKVTPSTYTQKEKATAKERELEDISAWVDSSRDALTKQYDKDYELSKGGVVVKRELEGGGSVTATGTRRSAGGGYSRMTGTTSRGSAVSWRVQVESAAGHATDFETSKTEIYKSAAVIIPDASFPRERTPTYTEESFAIIDPKSGKAYDMDRYSIEEQIAAKTRAQEAFEELRSGNGNLTVQPLTPAAQAPVPAAA